MKFAFCWVSLRFVGSISLHEERQTKRESSVACQLFEKQIIHLQSWFVGLLMTCHCHCFIFSPSQAKFRVELPGYPILGDGKGDNQNHAIPFMRGVFTQCIDANQGAYFDPGAAYLGDRGCHGSLMVVAPCCSGCSMLLKCELIKIHFMLLWEDMTGTRTFQFNFCKFALLMIGQQIQHTEEQMMLLPCALGNLDDFGMYRFWRSCSSTLTLDLDLNL
jgi:hypothetical protein